MSKPQLLILSFSSIAGDARVLKQVRLFRDRYAVTTCGYGPPPEGVVEHVRIPDDRPAHDLNGRLITLHWYRRALWSIPAVAWAGDALAGRRFDAVLANDLEAVPVAVRLAGGTRVHADLHEYTPRLHEEHEAWNRRIRPFHEWVARRYATRAASWTTVSGGLAREYERQFGFSPRIVTNAAPYADLQPTPVGDRIRIVHSGACLRNRNIMAMAEGVAAASAPVSLELYLTPNDPGYLEELRRFAEQSAGADGVPSVVLHDPVPYDSLIRTLNGFDLGIHVLPPVNFNNEWALPNKLFDYVQARLGVVVGPSAEMAEYVRTHDLGLVLDDFSAEALTRALDALDREAVAGFKRSADAAAEPMSAEAQVHVWADCVGRIIEEARA
ncbi:hypothetical protein BCL57_002373 [Agromyces flavus]|uniref:D-inositol 3-phosphate glycosyltransferase n=1 Tax=Agromyces flavus TaxID=589382 RepID=A0A1H1UJE8_9MICO|nr:hypothetical protein [Agromyces flavus]MCP2368200.1 hypothetical protein [Agromyces flavus]GGI47660.1 hypothetical protein GCM10010932_23480 [Agromyces flavus]SDS72605.1 hypothetical protein SAMN04489721_1802 [Agromyces flavus]